MDESHGDPGLHSSTGDGERQSSPVRESRLAALRREDSVLQGGYSSSGRTSPTLLQRSNSMQNTDKAQWLNPQQSGVSSPTTRSRSIRAQVSPSSSRSDLLSWSHSPHHQSPRSLSPESLLPEFRRGSPRLRSTSGRLAFQHFTRVGTFSKRGRGRLLRKSSTFLFIFLFLWFALDWWYLSIIQQTVPQSLNNSGSLQANTVSLTIPLHLQLLMYIFHDYIPPAATEVIHTVFLFLII